MTEPEAVVRNELARRKVKVVAHNFDTVGVRLFPCHDATPG